MLKVGLNQNQANYHNKQQKPAFAAKSKCVRGYVDHAIANSDGSAFSICENLGSIFYLADYEVRHHGNFNGARNTAGHLGKIGKEIQKSGNIELGNILINASGRVLGHIDTILKDARLLLKEGQLEDMYKKGLNKFEKRQVLLKKNLAKKIIINKNEK